MSFTKIDNDKVKVGTVGKRPVCYKRTNETERASHEDIFGKLNNVKLVIGKKEYTLKVPEILGWNNSTQTLTMEFCQGENLQHILCSQEGSTRGEGVAIMNEVLKKILELKVAWSDCAPRNIIVGDFEISFIDFEKYSKEPIKDNRAFLQHHVFGEYASFLLEDERMFSTEDVFSTQTSVPKLGKRTIAVARKLGLDPDNLSSADDLTIQKMFIEAESPYRKEDGSIVFPRLALDLFTGSGPTPNTEKYINEILKSKKSCEQRLRFNQKAVKHNSILNDDKKSKGEGV